MFKPFTDIEREEIGLIILAKENNFRKQIKNGKVVEDYERHFKQWQILINYVCLNKEWIYKECKFMDNENYETTTMILLSAAYKRR